MSDIDRLCDKVEHNRTKHDGKKTKLTTAGGVRQDFINSLVKHGTFGRAHYVLYKRVEGGRTFNLYVQDFDKDGNMI